MIFIWNIIAQNDPYEPLYAEVRGKIFGELSGQQISNLETHTYGPLSAAQLSPPLDT